MKYTTIIIVCLLSLNSTFAQPTTAFFNYDDAGNRTSGMIVVNITEPEIDLFLAEILPPNETSLGIENRKEDTSLEKENISVFPNPAESVVNVHVDSEKAVIVSLFDSTGKYLEEMLMNSTGFFNLSKYLSGTYYVIVGSADDRHIYKVIKR